VVVVVVVVFKIILVFNLPLPSPGGSLEPSNFQLKHSGTPRG
jgi:hypothetical protein